MTLRTVDDVLEHARWAARQAGNYPLATDLDAAQGQLRGDPDKDMEEALAARDSEHEDEISGLNQEHNEEINSLEEKNGELFTQIADLEEKLAYLEKENARLLAQFV